VSRRLDHHRDDDHRPGVEHDLHDRRGRHHDELDRRLDHEHDGDHHHDDDGRAHPVLRAELTRRGVPRFARRGVRVCRRVVGRLCERRRDRSRCGLVHAGPVPDDDHDHDDRGLDVVDVVDSTVTTTSSTTLTLLACGGIFPACLGSCPPARCAAPARARSMRLYAGHDLVDHDDDADRMRRRRARVSRLLPARADVHGRAAGAVHVSVNG
jgi:hypothetical protein